MTDYFDRVCKRNGAVIVFRDVTLSDLWANRENLLIPHKRDRMRTVNAAFYKLIQQIHAGKVLTDEEMMTSDYWKSMKHYHPHWAIEPLSRRAERQMRYKFRDGVNLYHDIKKNGMKNPLDLIVERGFICLYRGNRRLAILKTLGIQIVKVRYAIA